MIVQDWVTNFATKNGDVVDIQEQGKPRRGKEVYIQETRGDLGEGRRY